MPLKISVKPTSFLKPLQVMPGAKAWATYQGNAAHTGYVPGHFIPAQFTRRWHYTPAPGITHIGDLAIDNGIVFSIAYPTGGGTRLIAVSEETGQVLWTTALAGFNTEPPAVADGKVYVATAALDEKHLHIVDQKSGKVLQTQTFRTVNQQNNLAPTPYGAHLYAAGAPAGGLSKFDGTTGAQLWNAWRPTQQPWTPAVDGKYVYGYMTGLVAYQASDGALAFEIPDLAAKWAYTRPVILGDNNMAFSAAHIGYDLSRRTQAWSRSDPADCTTEVAAYAKGVLYAISAYGNEQGQRLVAIAADSGKTLWQAGLHGGPDAIVVSDNMVFLSWETDTIAVDLTSRQEVWRYPFGGKIAISDRGVLYVYGANGRIGAVNLR